MKKFFFFVALVCLAIDANAQIKQSTATTVDLLFVKVADGTPHTGIAATSITLRFFKQSDTSSSTVTTVTAAASGSANDCVEKTTGGVYNCEASSGNTDTLGRTLICGYVTGDYPDCVERDVVSSGYWDLVHTGPAAAPTNFSLLSINGSGQTAVASMANGTITSSAIATDAIGASQIAAAAITSSEAPNLDVVVSTRGTHAVKRNVGFQWGIQMMTSGGTPVTSGTPTCTRAIDSTTFAATTNTPSSLSADGFSELIISNADMNGTDYVILKCTVTSARNYYTIFKLEAP